MFSKKVVRKNLKNLQKNTCVGGSFLTKLEVVEFCYLEHVRAAFSDLHSTRQDNFGVTRFFTLLFFGFGKYRPQHSEFVRIC